MLKIIGWIFLGFLLFVFLLLFLPVHTRVRYDGAVQVWCGLGPVSLRLFPLKKKAERPKKEKTQAAETKSQPKKKKPAGQKLTWDTVCDYIRLALEALGAMRRRLVIRNLTCHVKVAVKDAAATALLYGRVAAGVSALYPVMERSLRVKKTDIAVDADFEGEKLDILADVTIAACPMRMLIAAVILLIRFLKIRRKSKQQDQPIQEKGGKIHE